MKIGILTYREEEFAEVVLLLRKKYLEGKHSANELSVIALKEAVIPEGTGVIVTDIEYLEGGKGQNVRHFFRQCRMADVETVVGAPEYGRQLVQEVLSAIDTVESRQTAGQGELRTFGRVIETMPEHDEVLQSGKTGSDALRIGVTGIGRSAGASFVAMSLAKELSVSKKYADSLVTVVSVGDTDVFEILGMEKRFSGRIFFRFYDAIKEKQSVRGRENVDERINWVVKTANDSQEPLSDEEKTRLLYRIRGDIIIWDFSCDERDDEIKKIVSESDVIICVIDPLPSKLLTAFTRLLTIRDTGVPIVYVINKYNKGVNKKQVLDFLKVKKPVYIPLIDQEHFYVAEYGCKLPYSNKDVNSAAGEAIGKLAAVITRV